MATDGEEGGGGGERGDSDGRCVLYWRIGTGIRIRRMRMRIRKETDRARNKEMEEGKRGEGEVGGDEEKRMGLHGRGRGSTTFSIFNLQS